MWRTTKEPIIVGIYCFKNLINGKRYVGQSIDIYQRYEQHIWRLDHKYFKRENKHLIYAWHKYGSENFEFTILEECKIEELDDREKYWIAYYDARRTGYNGTDGGKDANTYIRFTKKEMDDMFQGENCGHNKLTNQDIFDIIERFKNDEDDKTIANYYNVSPTTISKIRNHKNWTHLTEGLVFKKSKVKFRNMDKKKKAVDMYSRNGKYISTFSSLNDAACMTDILYTKIGAACRGEQMTAGGYVWRFHGQAFDKFPTYKEKTNVVAIDQYDLDWNFIQTFSSITDAEKTISCRGIGNALKENHFSGGYYWMKHGEKPLNKKHIKCECQYIAVDQYDLDWNYITSYPSIKIASQNTGAKESCIGNVLMGKIKTAGGYHWLHKDEQVPEDKDNHYFESVMKSIDQYDVNWIFIKTHKSISQATRDTNIKSIGNVLHGRQQTAGGYRWLYHGETPPVVAI